jgi:hypothetical protein
MLSSFPCVRRPRLLILFALFPCSLPPHFCPHVQFVGGRPLPVEHVHVGSPGPDREKDKVAHSLGFCFEETVGVAGTDAEAD